MRKITSDDVDDGWNQFYYAACSSLAQLDKTKQWGKSQRNWFKSQLAGMLFYIKLNKRRWMMKTNEISIKLEAFSNLVHDVKIDCA